MRCSTVRRVALPLALATALSGAAACSSSGPGDRPARQDAAHTRSLAALRSAERATERAGSARVESRTTMGSLMSLTAAGTLGWDGGVTGVLTLTYTGGTVADSMRRLGTPSMEARYLPDAYYARMGDRFAERTGGRHWIRYAYDDLDDLAGDSGAHLGDQMRTTTPNQSLRLLLGSRDVARVGEERVRGERATHYAGTVEVADVADDGLRTTLTRAGVTSQTVDVWVGERDLLVKKVEKARTATGVLTQTAHYDDYGVPVEVRRPPASDTRDVTDLVTDHGGGTS
ncbi:hypothetical protein ACIF8T_18755 [Streptomyces sp. NPDC085946]|uniref:hypothetical protein n=1 Tax=Streptomyces sp. NPDC085946 TaxID=3365744 RepID=UPI0037CEC714